MHTRIFHFSCSKAICVDTNSKQTIQGPTWKPKRHLHNKPDIKLICRDYNFIMCLEQEVYMSKITTKIRLPIVCISYTYFVLNVFSKFCNNKPS